MSASVELGIQLSGEQRSLIESLKVAKFAYKRRRDARMAMARIKGQWNEAGIDSSRIYQPRMIVQADTRPFKPQSLYGYLKRQNMQSTLGGTRIAV